VNGSSRFILFKDPPMMDYPILGVSQFPPISVICLGLYSWDLFGSTAVGIQLLFRVGGGSNRARCFSLRSSLGTSLL
jgi:hypothetical protein